MGCTSSAPNTLSTNASKEDKSVQLKDADETYSKNVETIDTESDNRTEMKVLPSSDTTEPVQLVRNYKSSTSLEPEKDLHTNGHIVEKEYKNTSETTKEAKDEENNDKISKLKLEVLGKFIEISQQNTDHDKDVQDCNTDDAAISMDIRNETNPSMEVESNETCDEHENNSEETEASPSPSQSQSTRWEALADIAAELPPSLAVDPITGQIYSLSK